MILISSQMGKRLKCTAASPCLFIVVVISTLLFQIATASGITTCPSEFDQHNGDCYKVNRNLQSWEMAMKNDNDYLAKLDTPAEIKNAAQILKSKQLDARRSVWAMNEYMRSYLTNIVIANLAKFKWYYKDKSIVFTDEQGNFNTPIKLPKCSALQPPDYDTFQMFDCETELYSLIEPNTSNIITLNFITIVGSTFCIAARFMSFSLN